MRAILLIAFVAALACTSCCRYRHPVYWSRDHAIPKHEVEKKDLKKGAQ